MKASQLVEVITDSVTDAVREVLPKLIAAEVEARLAAKVQPALDAVERAHEGVHSRLTDMQADFATRGVAQADSLTSSWVRQVENLREQIAEQIAGAVAALTLPEGKAGPEGPAGRAGRDATFTPPVHYKGGTIYERGALVQHRGGVWFANVETDAEPGEACSGFSLVLDGCEPLRVEAWGEAGELALVYRYASGVTRSIPLGFRPMAHVGIYDHGRAYLGNDVVTCDGSLWLAREKSTNVKPGTDEGRDAWRLIVKRGKDGRDGLPGPRGERGEPGAAAPAPRAPRAKANGGTA